MFFTKNKIQLLTLNKEMANYAVHMAVQKDKHRLTNEEIAKRIERNSQNDRK